MTQDEIIEMAQECKLIGMRPHLDGIYSESLEAFAKLVAAKNKERILQLIKELRPAIKPLEGMGRGKTTDEWFDILVKDIEEKL
jgi:hypothetical protein